MATRFDVENYGSLYFWVELSEDGRRIIRTSPRKYATPVEARQAMAAAAEGR
jgi:hypothetical protein